MTPGETEGSIRQTPGEGGEASARSKPGATRLGWSVESTEYLHRSRWHEVRQDRIRLPDGKTAVYTYVEHPGAVFVVPFDESMRLMLIRSYRYTIDRMCWETVAGGLGDRPGAAPEDVARDELREELGATCARLVPLGAVWFANGFADYRAQIFAAFGVRIDRRPQTEDLEVIAETRRVTNDECDAMLASGEISDGESALAVRMAVEYVRRNPEGLDLPGRAS